MANKSKKNNGSKKKSFPKSRVSWVIAKSKDGNIQITYTIPFEIIRKAQSDALEELAETTNVPGFRRGKAPKDVVKRHVQENTLLEKALSKVLPRLIGDTIKKEDLKLAVYPKFQLIKAEEGEDWEIRAQTAEMPEVNLGDYKKKIEGHIRANNLWVPGKHKGADEKREKSREEKEQEIIKALLESVDIEIPGMLIEEETNSRLSRLLERIENLGLDLDSYLSSLGKKPIDIRKEYEKQSRDTLTLELILTKVAEQEKIEVKKEDVNAAIKAASADKNLGKELVNRNKRKLIESMLRKRSALNFLVTSFNTYNT